MLNRREFLIGGGVAIVAGIGVRRATLPKADIDGLIAELVAMGNKGLRTTAGWSAYKVLCHLAQSIEYSMKGYPQMKSALFQHTAGAVAFFAFSTTGIMRHPLNEPIPGAPEIAEAGEVTSALLRLQEALKSFVAYEGALAPHFAYGQLSKEEYAHAHVMHVRDHFRLFDKG